MDFVDWCGRVLDTHVEAARDSVRIRVEGLTRDELALRVFGEPIAVDPDQEMCSRAKAIITAVQALSDKGRILPLIDPGTPWSGKFVVAGPPWSGSAGLVRGWVWDCADELDERQEELLRRVIDLSHRSATDHAWLEPVNRAALLDEIAQLGWDDGEVWLDALSGELHGRWLISTWYLVNDQAAVYPTYQGLVWMTRRGAALDSAFIDELLEDWETPTVDFKRELLLDSKSRKAQLVRAVVTLANTHASGKRWIIIGFSDDETYFVPANERDREKHILALCGLKQDDIQQVISSYVDPSITVTWRVVDYRLGPVGVLGVHRNPTHLPYRIKQAVGSGTRIRQGEVYIRDGTTSRVATDREEALLEELAERAKRRQARRAHPD